ncbi:MAG: winged helix-turn-helix domain-containing protein [Pyrinomonadaceae bacterium]
MREQNRYVYEFGPFHLDATRRVLLKEGEPVKLFPKEFDTLLALVERNGEVLEKDDLMRQVWQDQIVEEFAFVRGAELRDVILLRDFK